MITNSDDDAFGNIVLSSAFGEKFEAKLIKVTVTLKGDTSLNYPIEYIVALTSKLDTKGLIPSFHYEYPCSVNIDAQMKESYEESCDCPEKESDISDALMQRCFNARKGRHFVKRGK